MHTYACLWVRSWVHEVWGTTNVKALCSRHLSINQHAARQTELVRGRGRPAQAASSNNICTQQTMRLIAVCKCMRVSQNPFGSQSNSIYVWNVGYIVAMQSYYFTYQYSCTFCFSSALLIAQAASSNNVCIHNVYCLGCCLQICEGITKSIW